MDAGDRLLVLLRHGKAEWSASTDEERPLTPRGARQAAEAGQWLGAHVALDLAVVSVARRAQQTWDLAVPHLSEPPPRHDSEPLYTFDGHDVLDLVRSLPDTARSVVMVGHNPGFEEAVELLTGERRQLTTCAVAAIGLGPWPGAGAQPGVLLAHGRPPSGSVAWPRE